MQHDTKTDFQILCGQHLIDPSIALENDQVIDCLLSMRDASCDNAYNGYRNCLVRILETQF